MDTKEVTPQEKVLDLQNRAMYHALEIDKHEQERLKIKQEAKDLLLKLSKGEDGNVNLRLTLTDILYNY